VYGLTSITMLAGHELDDRIKNAISKVGLYVPVISPEFCDPNSFAYKEFEYAIQIQNDRRLSKHQDRFIVPILHGMDSPSKVVDNVKVREYLTRHLYQTSTDKITALVDVVLEAYGIVEDVFCPSGIEGLEMGRFPVTNVEYRRFINEGGYTNAGLKKWWSSKGQQFWLKYALRESHDHFGQIGESVTKRTEDASILANMSSTHGLFNSIGQPVTGVCYYEAEAYCNWLTSKGLDGGHVVRLPKQFEWLQAAKNEEHKFPWGNEKPTSKIINIVDRKPYNEQTSTLDNVDLENLGKINVPNRFGTYAQGMSPTGCQDMYGNVWEWLGDWIDAAQAKGETGDEFNLGKIAGHCCFDPPERLLTNSLPIQYRRPGYRHYVIGFRVARERIERG